MLRDHFLKHARSQHALRSTFHTRERALRAAVSPVGSIEAPVGGSAGPAQPANCLALLHQPCSHTLRGCRERALDLIDPLVDWARLCLVPSHSARQDWQPGAAASTCIQSRRAVARDHELTPARSLAPTVYAGSSVLDGGIAHRCCVIATPSFRRPAWPAGPSYLTGKSFLFPDLEGGGHTDTPGGTRQ